ncbi:MAG: hypothetical protein ABEH86_01490 [Haloarcula sp.]
MSANNLDIEPIVRDGYIEEQGQQASVKYVPYSAAYCLRAVMEMVSPDNIQFVRAMRQPRRDVGDIDLVANSPVSDFVEGVHTEGKRVDVHFDRGDYLDVFPWDDVEDVLDENETAYDLPISKLVLRFEDEEGDFTDLWRSKIDDAIEDPNFPLDWIEPPFFVEMESADPGDSDIADHVKEVHDDRYFHPRSNTVNGEQGLGLRPRTLDVTSVQSFANWTGSTDSELQAWSERQAEEWTPEKVENRLMNFFNRDVRYAGMLHDSAMTNRLVDKISDEHMAPKTFNWVEDEEWIQQ